MTFFSFLKACVRGVGWPGMVFLLSSNGLSIYNLISLTDNKLLMVLLLVGASVIVMVQGGLIAVQDRLIAKLLSTKG